MWLNHSIQTALCNLTNCESDMWTVLSGATRVVRIISFFARCFPPPQARFLILFFFRSVNINPVMRFGTHPVQPPPPLQPCYPSSCLHFIVIEIESQGGKAMKDSNLVQKLSVTCRTPTVIHNITCLLGL